MKKNLHGVVLLDKHSGITSNAALQKIKRHLGAKKAGHTGSLDPLASGLLPICLGQATKVCEYLLGSSKRYQAKVKLGVTTNTYDSEGEVVERCEVVVSEEQINTALGLFEGQIKQVPPMFSALKKDGQPLYKLARQGKEVTRAARSMTVHSLAWTQVKEKELLIDIHCSSGFYVRSLAHDLGQELGCGAHLTGLRRTSIKDIDLGHARDLESALQCDVDELLLPIDSLLQDIPRVEISTDQANSLLQGRPTLVNQDGVPEASLMRIYVESGSLFALGKVNSQRQIKTEKIFVYD